MSSKACQYCARPIRFFKTRAGRWMPCDPCPSEHMGTVHVQAGVARVVNGDELAQLRKEGYPLYVPHGATCPVPPTLRGPRRRARRERREPAQLELGGAA